jgi:cytochrome c-type biogenesis protein
MNESVGLLSAFLGGVISFLSPCVLPLVPGYVTWMAGQGSETGQDQRLRRIMSSVSFVLGFATVFIILGASFSALGQSLQAYKDALAIFGGVLIALLGLMMTGAINLNWLMRDYRFSTQNLSSNPFTAYVLGLAFAFGWTPCIGPVLGAILTLSAVSTHAREGMLLLMVYSIGLGVPFITVAIFFESLRVKLRKFTATAAWLYKLSGWLMVLMGVALATGWITRLGTWLLATFPFFSRLG